MDLFNRKIDDEIVLFSIIQGYLKKEKGGKKKRKEIRDSSENIEYEFVHLHWNQCCYRLVWKNDLKYSTLFHESFPSYKIFRQQFE